MDCQQNRQRQKGPQQNRLRQSGCAIKSCTQYNIPMFIVEGNHLKMNGTFGLAIKTAKTHLDSQHVYCNQGYGFSRIFFASASSFS